MAAVTLLIGMRQEASHVGGMQLTDIKLDPKHQIELDERLEELEKSFIHRIEPYLVADENGVSVPPPKISPPKSNSLETGFAVIGFIVLFSAPLYLLVFALVVGGIFYCGLHSRIPPLASLTEHWNQSRGASRYENYQTARNQYVLDRNALIDSFNSLSKNQPAGVKQKTNHLQKKAEINEDHSHEQLQPVKRGSTNLSRVSEPNANQIRKVQVAHPIQSKLNELHREFLHEVSDVITYDGRGNLVPPLKPGDGWIDPDKHAGLKSSMCFFAGTVTCFASCYVAVHTEPFLAIPTFIISTWGISVVQSCFRVSFNKRKELAEEDYRQYQQAFDKYEQNRLALIEQYEKQESQQERDRIKIALQHPRVLLIRCRNCGLKNDEYHKFCANCGETLL